MGIIGTHTQLSEPFCGTIACSQNNFANVDIDALLDVLAADVEHDLDRALRQKMKTPLSCRT